MTEVDSLGLMSEVAPAVKSGASDSAAPSLSSLFFCECGKNKSKSRSGEDTATSIEECRARLSLSPLIRAFQ